jgi:hypothetical protein
VLEDVAKHGGVPILWRTGHSFIKAKMHEEGALLAIMMRAVLWNMAVLMVSGFLLFRCLVLEGAY